MLWRWKKYFSPLHSCAFSFHHSCWYVKCYFASVSALDLITVTAKLTTSSLYLDCEDEGNTFI